MCRLYANTMPFDVRGLSTLGFFMLGLSGMNAKEHQGTIETVTRLCSHSDLIPDYFQRPKINLLSISNPAPLFLPKASGNH